MHTLDTMMDFDLTQEMCLLAIKENAGLEILLNLLDTVEVKSQVSCKLHYMIKKKKKQLLQLGLSLFCIRSDL